MIVDDYGWLWMIMDDYGWLWMTMDDYGWLWMIMDDYGWLWMIMDDYGWLWMIMDDYGWLWMIMDDYGWLWMIMDDYGWLWMIMDDYGWLWMIMDDWWLIIHWGYWYGLLWMFSMEMLPVKRQIFWVVWDRFYQMWLMADQNEDRKTNGFTMIYHWWSLSWIYHWGLAIAIQAMPNFTSLRLLESPMSLQHWP